MITLYTFGPMFGLPDASPFVTKALVLMKMSGLAKSPSPNPPNPQTKSPEAILALWQRGLRGSFPWMEHPE